MSEFSGKGEASHDVQTKRHSQDAEPRVEEPDRRVNDALTDLSVYALTLEAELHQLEHRVFELAESESSVAERRAVLRERDELSEELKAFRRALMALRDQVLRRPTVNG